jgi:hypothetical protein
MVLLAARGHDQLVGGQVARALGGHEGGDLLAQRLVALGRSVLQRRAGLLLQGCLGGGADAGHVEHGAVGEAARKADDAGLAQQLEQLADGGGFYVVQTVGELHGQESLYRCDGKAKAKPPLSPILTHHSCGMEDLLNPP